MACIRSWFRAFLLAMVLLVLWGAAGHLVGGATSVALADTPACGNPYHTTAPGQAWECSNGPDGYKYDMRCQGNLREGPGLGYAIHGLATGSEINQYRDVRTASYANGGCGGPTTNEWYLSSNGWVSVSITKNLHNG